MMESFLSDATQMDREKTRTAPIERLPMLIALPDRPVWKHSKQATGANAC